MSGQAMTYQQNKTEYLNRAGQGQWWLLPSSAPHEERH